MRTRAATPLLLLASILVGACADDDPGGTEVVVDDPEPAGAAADPGEGELALPDCDTIPELDAPPPLELSSDPEVAEWQRRRAEFGLAGDEASTLAAQADPATDPVEDLGFPMTQEEADAFFAHQASSGDLATRLQEAHGDEDWFGGVWLDNVRQATGVGVVGDVEARQAELDAEYGAGAVIAVAVEHSEAELAAVQAEVSAWMEAQDVRSSGNGRQLLKNVVAVYLEVLDPAVVADLAETVGTDAVCVEGAEPDEVVPEGPQPQAGEGWRLLADEPGIGRPYATGFAADQATYEALWSDIGLPGSPPAVDFGREVVAWFGPAVSGSCPEIRMDDVVFDDGTAVLRPEIVLIGGARGCTDDANPHAYVVAFERAQLAERFTVSIEPPNAECCEEGTTAVDLSGS